jgi:hypothetical protein
VASLNGLCSATISIGNNNSPTPTISLSLLGAVCNLGTAVVSFSVAYVGVPSSAQTFTMAVTVVACQTAGPRLSVRSGRWHDASTWACGLIPFADDIVRIQPTHSITIATGQTAYCRTLQFDNPQTRLIYEANTRLVMGGTSIPRNGLIAYYPFNGDANDYSGNNNHGTPINSPVSTNDRYGRANSAYLFNGTNQYVEVPNSTSLQNLSSGITITAWVRVDGWYLDWGLVACKCNGQNNQFQLAVLNRDGQNSQYYLHSDGVLPGERIGEDIVFGRWFHVAMTMSGQNRSFYYNGSLIGSPTNYPTLTPYNTPLYIGRDPYLRDEYHIGALDEVTIYSRPLTGAEVRQLYLNERP